MRDRGEKRSKCMGINQWVQIVHRNLFLGVPNLTYHKHGCRWHAFGETKKTLNKEERNRRCNFIVHIRQLPYPPSRSDRLSLRIHVFCGLDANCAQSQTEGQLREPDSKTLNKQSNPQGIRKIWASSNPPGTGDWLFRSYAIWVWLIMLSAKHTPDATDAGRCTSVGFVRFLWLVLNQGLVNSPRLITEDQSTWRRAPDIRLGTRTCVKYRRKQCLGISSQSLLETRGDLGAFREAVRVPNLEYE